MLSPLVRLAQVGRQSESLLQQLHSQALLASSNLQHHRSLVVPSQSQQQAASTEQGSAVATLEQVKIQLSAQPRAFAELLSSNLTPTQKALLLEHLNTKKVEPDEKYVEELFEAADEDGDKGKLTRQVVLSWYFMNSCVGILVYENT